MEKKLLFGMLLFFAFIQSCDDEDKNIEPKYQLHQTYDEFLTYLNSSIDTIADNYNKLSFVRKKVSELIDGGTGIRDASVIDKNWPSWKGERYYNIFLYDSATVDCGGSSNFLKEVYKDLGYTSVTYDMGCPMDFTHQTTLVKNPSDNNFYIQDAFYNAHFEDNKGKKLSFIQMMKILLNRKHNNLDLIIDSFDFVPDFDTTGLTQITKRNSYAKEIVDSVNILINNGEKLTRFDTSQIGFTIRCSKSKCYQSSHLPENILYLYLLPLKQNSKTVFKLYNKAMLN